MIKKGVILIIIFFILSLNIAGCSKAEDPKITNLTLYDDTIPGDNGTGDTGDGEGTIDDITLSASLKSLNIDSNTESLFIAPKETASKFIKGDGTINVLYKITDTGSIEEISYYDEVSTVLTIEQEPSAIYNVDATYVIIIFHGGATNESFLVRKTDGAVFSLANVGAPSSYYSDNYPGDFINTDSGGNIFFVAYGSGSSELVKIDVSDPENLTKTTWSVPDDFVSMFAINQTGNACYRGTDSMGNQVLRAVYASGGARSPSGSANMSWIYWWTDFLDQMYYYNGNVYEVDFGATYADYSETSLGSLSVGCGFSALYKMATPNRIIAIGGCSSVYQLYPLLATKSMSGIFGLDDVVLSCASDTHYYMHGPASAGGSILIKVDPTDDTFVQLLPTAAEPAVEYSIYKMTVSATNELTFNAMRLSDFAKVIGKINATGTLSILDETIDQELVVLERIN